jgi:hypothetical protein
VVRTFLESNVDTMNLFDLTEKVNFNEEEWEKWDKKVRSDIDYFNKQIWVKFNIWKIFWIKDGAVVKQIPVILNNSD